MSENRAIWKSNNQGFKEVTFTQTGGRGRDAEARGEALRGGGMWRCEWAVSHPHVVDKNQEGYLGSEGSQTQTRPPSLGFQLQEDKSP